MFFFVFFWGGGGYVGGGEGGWSHRWLIYGAISGGRVGMGDGGGGDAGGNMGLYVPINHSGLLGTGKLGGREFLYLTPTRYTVTTRMTLHYGGQLCEPF